MSCCEIGRLGEREDNVVVIGGSCSLAAFDHTGQEVLWSVTGDNIASLAIVDVQNRGFNDLVVGSEDFEIRVFREDDIINEITETEVRRYSIGNLRWNCRMSLLIDRDKSVFAGRFHVRLWAG